ncbi:ATP-dependent RecD-like DNA helicase [Thalassospira xianhensis]|uniref:SF1B family DNA helicase RecD2 n=1 Tax=Thalassospira xianhensis TaxID=478503 RepID=UPI000DED46EB|nr:ATP-dependent RecD-like DNA helicase [Thalassospira xianhensis]
MGLFASVESKAMHEQDAEASAAHPDLFTNPADTDVVGHEMGDPDEGAPAKAAATSQPVQTDLFSGFAQTVAAAAASGARGDSTKSTPKPVNAPISSFGRSLLRPEHIEQARNAEPEQVAPTEEDAELKGKVKKVIFRSAEGTFIIMAVTYKNEEGVRTETTVKANTIINFGPGDDFSAKGKWGEFKGAKQFTADLIRHLIPSGAKGIVAWIKTGAVPGVGEAAAQRMASFFGENLRNVMKDAAKLAECGIPIAKAEAIVTAWRFNEEQPELMTLLMDAGLKPKQTAKVMEHFGAAAMEMIQTNPWEMVSVIEGIGFPTADRIAERNDIAMTSHHRIREGYLYALSEAVHGSGHCGLPKADLVSKATDLLHLHREHVEAHLPVFLDDLRVVDDEVAGLIYPRRAWESEEEVASKLYAMLKNYRPSLSEQQALEKVELAEKMLGKRLDRDGGQLEAAMLALRYPVVIITGGPGTGKSTTQDVICKALELAGQKEILLAAPTGRAAKRLSETTGRDASTIHRLLMYDGKSGQFRHNEDNPLNADVSVADEYSMVDIFLCASKFEAIEAGNTSVIMTGDVEQLPSVGPGQVLRDLIDAGHIPTARLTKVHRQAAGSGIAIAAKRINSGQSVMEPNHPMTGMRIRNSHAYDTLADLVKIIRTELPEMGYDPMQDVQVLAAQRRGSLGVETLNQVLKKALNPAYEDDNTVVIEGQPYTVGDRVMQIRNDYTNGVFNGEVGSIIAVEDTGPVGGKDNSKRILYVDFSGHTVTYRGGDVANLDLAYACTVHKSQGCEFPAVIFVAPQEHRRSLNRNLLYTGITRARQECILLGSPSAIEGAVHVLDVSRRHTGLKRRLDLLFNLQNINEHSLQDEPEPEMEFPGMSL